MAKIITPSTYPVTCHTDFVGKGSTFVAIPGKKINGISFIDQALQKRRKPFLLIERYTKPRLVNSYSETVACISHTK